MKTKLRFLLPWAVLLGGCSGSDAPAPELPACLLVEQVSTLTYDPVLLPDNPIPTQTITTRLDYTDKQVLATVFKTEDAGDYFERADLKYNKKGQLTEIIHQHYRYVNEYNGQGKLARQTRYADRMGDHKEEETGYYTLAYNGRQELAEAHYVSMASGKATPELTWRYTYVEGDPLYIEQLEPGGESYYQAKLTYDNKHLSSPSFAHIYFEPLRPPSVHNQVSYTVQNKNPSYASHTTVYTYNAEGFPVTATTRFTDGREQVVTYTYQCQ